MVECDLCSGLGFIYIGIDGSECPRCLGTGEVDDGEDGERGGDGEEDP